MIRDLAAHQRLRVADERRALRALSIDDTIAIAEALLTSSLLDHVDRRGVPRPVNLARSLGLRSDQVVRPHGPTTV